MDLTFERGNPNAPKGHAVVYFRSLEDSSQVQASYLVILPIPLNITKYIPPMFASQAAHLSPAGIAAFPFPPVPEVVESYEYLQSIAELRDDDLIYGGTLDSKDLEGALNKTTDIMQTYQSYYTTYKDSAPRPSKEREPEPITGSSVDEVLLSFSSERDKLAELSKLIGKLRFGVDSRDSTLIKEGLAEMKVLGKHLAEKYDLDNIAKVVQIPGPRGQKLSQLYIERCYKLCDDDYAGVARAEEAIRALEAEAT